jgi:quinol monooxygenase YgiN
MSIRLIVNFVAAPGKSAEYLEAWQARCRLVEAEEPGCEQYEIFQSALDPHKLALLEHWTTQEAFDAHVRLGPTRPRVGEGLSVGPAIIEDYIYNPRK